MQVRRVLCELKNADVTRVSLVDHGANRIPFRIVKRNKTGAKKMSLNLNDVRRLFKNDAGVKVAPTLMALVFESEPKGTELDRIKSVVEKAGFKTDSPKVTTDNAFMFQQQPVDETDESLTLVQLSPDMAAVFKGFAPWTDALENFTEVMQANNFYPGLGSACNALNQAICMKMQNASDPGEAVTAVTAVLKDFSDYVAELAQALPVNAFKVANEFAPVMKTIKAERVSKAAVEAIAKAAKPGEVVTPPVTPAVATPVEPVVKAMTKPDDVKQTEWDAMDDDAKKAACAKKGDTTPVVTAPVVPASVDVAAITKSVTEAMAASLAGITSAVAKVGTDIDALKVEVAAVSKDSGDLKKKFETAVLGGPPAEENPLKVTSRTMKGDGPFGGACDTAMAPKNFRN